MAEDWEDSGMSKEEYEQAMEDHMLTVKSTSQTDPIVGKAIRKLFEYGIIVIPTKSQIPYSFKDIPDQCRIIYSFQATIDDDIQKHLLIKIVEALDTPKYEGRYEVNNNIINLIGYETK